MRDFKKLLPQARHALIYPAVAEVPRAKGSDIIIVASDNYGNYVSLRWFLEEVAPLARRRARCDLRQYRRRREEPRRRAL